MTVINHGLQTLTDEIIIPHSGWRRDATADPSKLQSADWTTVFKNTSGCLRYNEQHMTSNPCFFWKSLIMERMGRLVRFPLSVVSYFCRNVSSDGAEARQRLRECDGLVDALLHALQSAVINKDADNKVTETVTLATS